MIIISNNKFAIRAYFNFNGAQLNIFEAVH